MAELYNENYNDVVAVVDDTFFNSGEDGIAVFTGGIGISQAFGSTNYYSWSYVQRVEYENNKIYLHYYLYDRGGERGVKSTGCTLPDKSLVRDLLRRINDYIRDSKNR